jgi:hypothetical protein
MEIALLYFEGCPHSQVAEARVRKVAREAGAKVRRQEIASSSDAERLGFRGSPTILVDGRDPFVRGAPSQGLSCRLYDTPAGAAGAPTIEQLRAALAGRA